MKTVMYMNNIIKKTDKITIIKNENMYYLINKTENRVILTDNEGNYIILNSHDKYITDNSKVVEYV